MKLEKKKKKKNVQIFFIADLRPTLTMMNDMSPSSKPHAEGIFSN